jgi:hypothetical protein
VELAIDAWLMVISWPDSNPGYVLGGLCGGCDFRRVFSSARGKDHPRLWTARFCRSWQNATSARRSDRLTTRHGRSIPSAAMTR